MSTRPKEQAELFLAVTDSTDIPCARCNRIVDFAKSCELARRPNGQFFVSSCHVCVSELDLRSEVHHLVDVLGVEGARAEITRALSLPTPGSHWRYTDPRSPADRLEFTFLRFAGHGLVFDGPCGEWFCSREDWANHLATFRVRPFVAAPVRAQA